MSTRIVLTTGGTGGHVFPALAVAEQLRKLCPDVDLLFVGSIYGPEARLAALAGVNFQGLSVRGVLGRGFRAIAAMAGMAGAVFKARTILSQFRPQAVAGFGAYASVPALVAARLSGIPLAIHEQNAVPGVSNRLLGRMADKIFLSLPDGRGAFPKNRARLTGNPVRAAVAALYTQPFAPVDGRKPRLLVMGGSQGAKAVNSIILGALRHLHNVDIRHQTGETDYERVHAGYTAHGHAGNVSPFINDMAAAYAWADLALCRSGASTVAELALAGKPAVCIPFPHATHDHQSENALALAQVGAARLIPERDLPGTDVPALMLDLLFDTDKLRTMSLAARSLARPHAAHEVAEGLLALCASRPDKGNQYV